MDDGAICTRTCNGGAEAFGNYMCTSGSMTGQAMCIEAGVAEKLGLEMKIETKMTGEANILLGGDDQMSDSDLAMMLQEVMADEMANPDPTTTPTAALTTMTPTTGPKATTSPTTGNPTVSPTLSPTMSPTGSPTNATTSPTAAPIGSRRLMPRGLQPRGLQPRTPQSSSGGNCSNKNSRNVQFAVPLTTNEGGLGSQSILLAVLARLANRTGRPVCMGWAQEPAKVEELVIRTATGEVFDETTALETSPPSSSKSVETANAWTIALVVVMLLIISIVPLFLCLCYCKSKQGAMREVEPAEESVEQAGPEPAEKEDTSV